MSDYQAPFMTGTFVWSGFDYIGEARGWPQNTKCRGTVADVAGFTKETAYWLRSWWLSNISSDDAGRPANPPAIAPASTGTPALQVGSTADNATIFILDAWTPPPGGAKTRTVHVYSNAASVQLLLNSLPASGAAKQVYVFELHFPTNTCVSTHAVRCKISKWVLQPSFSSDFRVI